MAARQALLASMRRIRRRRRAVAAVTGFSTAVAWAGPPLAIVALLLRRASAEVVGAPWPWLLSLSLVGVAGGVAGARRKISLLTCARGVDATLRTREAGDAGDTRACEDDCVLAAVALAQEGSGATTPFIDALTVQAVARARRLSPGQSVPPLPRLSLVVALGSASALVVVLTFVPAMRSRTPAAVRQVKANVSAAITDAQRPRLRLAADDVEAEQEESSRAGETGRAARDGELERLADDFTQRLADLTAPGGAPREPAMARLSHLTLEAQAAADVSAAAEAAATGARHSLASARGVGSDASDLAHAAGAAFSDSSEDAPGTAAAAAAAARLVARGETGRAVLQRAAESALAALAGAAGTGTGTGTATKAGTRDGTGRGEDGPRRLDDDRESGAGEHGDPPFGPAVVDEQRQLQRLRRDLETASADCRADPATCQRSAETAGRALADLHRRGQTAPARQRLADAARQLLDRIRRRQGTPAAPEREAMGRFAREARGASERTAGGGGAVHASEGSPASNGEMDPAGIVNAAPGKPSFAPAGAESARAGDPGTSSGRSAGSSTSAVSISGSSLGTAPAGGGGPGAGIAGQARGGRILGSPTRATSLAARDAAVHVASDAAGPSRAQVIGAAGARGFAAAEYRRVFDDYHAAVEESLDPTSVPPDRRALVRRYFQLIRPRAP